MAKRKMSKAKAKAAAKKAWRTRKRKYGKSGLTKRHRAKK